MFVSLGIPSCQTGICFQKVELQNAWSTYYTGYILSILIMFVHARIVPALLYCIAEGGAAEG